MVKSVLYGKESRDKILAGVKKITDAVRVTMGANGKCVLIGEAYYGKDGIEHLPNIVTKDGYSVTRFFQLDDPIENRGALMIKEAALKTVEIAGDSTTATCVLAEAIISAAIELINNGSNSQLIKKGMDLALIEITESLAEISTPVRGDIDKVRQVATVSSNNDAVIGGLIADAISKIGFDGVIDIAASSTNETTIKTTDGYTFDKGWISRYFLTNTAKETCEYENPLILVYQNKINHHTQIAQAIKISNYKARPLLIICEDAVDEGLAYLAINNAQRNCRVCVVQASGVGEARIQNMEDIALLTGATFVSDIRGVDIKSVEEIHLGEAAKIIVSKPETVIIGGNKNKQPLEDLLNDLKMNLTQAESEEEKNNIEKRIAKLTGSVAVIHVGAATETEQREKIDRVDDAIRSTKSAISEGFVAGGGTAFLRIQSKYKPKFEGDIEKGRKVLFDSLSMPFKQICINSGEDADALYNEAIKMSGNQGYNVLKGEFVDMVKEGIIDSTKALNQAITNAESTSVMVITSECSIITVS